MKRILILRPKLELTDQWPLSRISMLLLSPKIKKLLVPRELFVLQIHMQKLCRVIILMRMSYYMGSTFPYFLPVVCMSVIHYHTPRYFHKKFEEHQKVDVNQIMWKLRSYEKRKEENRGLTAQTFLFDSKHQQYNKGRLVINYMQGIKTVVWFINPGDMKRMFWIINHRGM